MAFSVCGLQPTKKAEHCADKLHREFVSSDRTTLTLPASSCCSPEGGAQAPGSFANPQDAWDVASARSVCSSWRAAGEQLRHPQLTVFTDSDRQTLLAAKRLRTGVQV